MIFFEKIYYFKLIDNITSNINNYSSPHSIEKFIFLHRSIFSSIYDWGGQLRSKADDQIVVGNHNGSTQLPDRVENDLNNFFERLPSLLADTNHLHQKLSRIHTELAWIHPFKDGNGRVIRLFCQLIALNCNYILKIESLNGRKKHYYNYAVRTAIERKNYSHLNKIMFKLLEPIR